MKPRTCAQVRENGTVEHRRLLRKEGDARAELDRRNLVRVPTAQKHAPRVGLDE